MLFQSTPSPRRETQRIRLRRRTHSISIHSLPKEGDLKGIGAAAVAADFNPLPPQGGRQAQRRASGHGRHFNPLPPQGGRPDVSQSRLTLKAISIHSLPKEGDAFMTNSPNSLNYFNPLPPQGGRPCIWHDMRCDRDEFQSTPSPRRETRLMRYCCSELKISIHSLPKEGDVGGMLI